MEIQTQILMERLMPMVKLKKMAKRTGNQMLKLTGKLMEIQTKTVKRMGSQREKLMLMERLRKMEKLKASQKARLKKTERLTKKETQRAKSRAKLTD